MDIEQARKFGQMESRLDSLERSMEELKLANRRMEDVLGKVAERLAVNTGGIKTLVTLLTLSAALGGLVTKLAEVFTR